MKQGVFVELAQRENDLHRTPPVEEGQGAGYCVSL